MVTYRAVVSDELLPELTEENLPKGLRIIEVGEHMIGPLATWVRFEDDNAPAHLEGQHVCPWFTRNHETGEVTVSTYTVVD